MDSIIQNNVELVKKIEFCALSNSEVLKLSVFKKDPMGIDLPELYDDTKPKQNGLMYLHLG